VQDSQWLVEQALTSIFAGGPPPCRLDAPTTARGRRGSTHAGRSQGPNGRSGGRGRRMLSPPITGRLLPQVGPCLAHTAGASRRAPASVRKPGPPVWVLISLLLAIASWQLQCLHTKSESTQAAEDRTGRPVPQSNRRIRGESPPQTSIRWASAAFSLLCRSEGP
jgi:hypothetical protein